MWKDSKRASEAAEVMRLTADDLLHLQIIERVIPEPEHYTTENLNNVCAVLEQQIRDFLEKYTAISESDLTEKRYGRFRRM